jgi:hypothetical protein
MPNAIKYSTSNVSNTIRKGNMVLGVNSVGYGPTNTTGFYSGYQTPNNGYVIYINKPTNGPAIYAPSNDTELINIVIKLGGSGINTAVDALTWINGQSNMVVINQVFDNIVTDNLIFAMDSSFTASYPKGNSTIYDVSGNGNNGSLVNGVSYTSGVLQFDASDDRINTGIGNIGSNASFESVFVSRGNVNTYNMLIGQLLPYIGVFNGNSIIYSDYVNSIQVYPIAGSITTNRWTHVICTRFYNGSNTNLKIYINGTLISDTAYPGSPTFYGNIMAIGDGQTSSWYPFYGDIEISRIYSKTLSYSEVSQNYYGGGITTNGLVLSMDGANIVSYPRNGTTWYDMSGSGYAAYDGNFQISNNGRYSLWSNSNGVYIPSSGILNNDYHTIEFLLMFKSSDSYPNGYTGGWQQFFNYDGGGSDRTPGIWRYPSEVRIHWRYDPSNTGIDFGKNSSGDQFDLNKYYHVIVTKDGGFATAYVNGTVVNTAYVSSPKTSGNGIVRFFAYYTQDLMEIQVCRIYNRVLTPNEVSINYNAVINRI